jgi:hypothetical protein
MDGAGTIFDRIEQRLSALGVNADIAGLRNAAAEYDAKVSSNPADLESKMIGLELKVVMLARLLNASIDVLEAGNVGAVAAAPQETAASTPAGRSRRPGRRPGSGTGKGRSGRSA